MSTRIRSWSAGFVLAAVAGVSACSPAGGSVPVPTLTSTAIPQTSAPTPQTSDTPGDTGAPTEGASTGATPSVTPTSPTEDQAVAQAKQAVTRFYQVSDEIAASSDLTSVQRFAEVAVGNELAEAQKFSLDNKAKGYVQTGSTSVISKDVFSIDLTADLAAEPPVVPTIIFNICYDVTGVDVLGPDGQSVVLPERAERASSVLTVANYEWPAASGWKISTTVVQGDPC